MRLNIQQVRRSVIGSGRAYAAALVPAALFVFAPFAQAQSVDQPNVPAASVSSVTNPAPDVVPATTATLSPTTSGTAAQDLFATADTTPANAAETRATEDTTAATPLRPAADPVSYGDDGTLAGNGALDDLTLSHQRGGAVGMVMVAATPQLMRGGGSVTLWDEIAPPAPLPIPVDASQNAQGNVASYTRK